MKRLLRVVVVLAIVTGALWWFTRPTEESPVSVKVAAAPLAPKPSPPQVAITPPPAPPVPAPPEAEPTPSVADDSHAADIAALRTRISEFISLLEANDGLGFSEKSLPPEARSLEAQGLEKLQDHIDQYAVEHGEPIPPRRTLEQVHQSIRDKHLPLQPAMQGILGELKAVKDSTPKFNKTGDKVEYSIDPAVAATLFGNPQKIYFQKIDGEWYVGN